MIIVVCSCPRGPNGILRFRDKLISRGWAKSELSRKCCKKRQQEMKYKKEKIHSATPRRLLLRHCERDITIFTALWISEVASPGICQTAKTCWRRGRARIPTHLSKIWRRPKLLLGKLGLRTAVAPFSNPGFSVRSAREAWQP